MTEMVVAERLVYRPSECIAMLGCSRSHFYEMLADGTVPARLIGGRWFIPRRQFDELLMVPA